MVWFARVNVDVKRSLDALITLLELEAIYNSSWR
jgi:hypothetical protein